MRKKTSVELGIIAVTAVALVFAVPSLFPKKQRLSRATASSPANASEALRAPLRGLGFLKPVIKIKPMKDDNFYVRFCRVADALPLERDPFSFSWTGPRTTRDDLVLSGILWDERKPTAVINGVFYGVGDSSGQFTVTEIEDDTVRLKDGSGDFTLRLKR